MRTIQNVEIVFEGEKQQPEMHLQLHEFSCLVPLLLLKCMFVLLTGVLALQKTFLVTAKFGRKRESIVNKTLTDPHKLDGRIGTENVLQFSSGANLSTAENRKGLIKI